MEQIRMKNFRVVEGNDILLDTDNWDEAKACQREAHRKNPFLYHEIHPMTGIPQTSQLEPGDDPETGRRKWCHNRITNEESDNGKSQSCLECKKKYEEGYMIHCPWQYISSIPYSTLQKIMMRRKQLLSTNDRSRYE
jgi:hypothetical protein